MAQLGIETSIVNETTSEGTPWNVGEATSCWLAQEMEEQSFTLLPGITNQKEETAITSYFAEVLIGSVRIKALIDTGASCSVLSSSIVEASQELLDSCVETIKSVRGVGNINIPMEATLRTKMRVGRTETTLNFAVVESKSLPVTAILGNIFLSKYKFILDMGEGK